MTLSYTAVYRLYLTLTLYSAKAIITSNHTKLVDWPLMGELLLRYSEEGTGQGCSQPSPLLAVSNITVHPTNAQSTDLQHLP